MTRTYVRCGIVITYWPFGSIGNFLAENGGDEYDSVLLVYEEKGLMGERKFRNRMLLNLYSYEIRNFMSRTD